VVLEAHPSSQSTPVVSAWIEAARARPRRAALLLPDAVLTYGELLAEAEAVARDLRDRQLVGLPVALEVDDRRVAIPRLLGVLLARACVVPIDLTLPHARRQAMIQVSAARALITRHGAITEISQAGCVPPNNDAAYIFFTSGSTGTPKGVIGTWAGLEHYVAWAVDALGFRDDDVIAQLASLSFDASLKDILPALAVAGQLAVASNSPYDDLPALADWLADSPVSVIQTVPSIAAPLARELATSPRRVPGSLRALVLAGEPVRADLIRQWRSISRADIWNLYGLTETTIIKTAFRVPADGVLDPVHAGRPLPGVRLEFRRSGPERDGHGEIVIRTPFALGGYVGATAEHEARWLVDENGHRTGYRTGDLGHLDPDGHLIVQGRVDDQVKLSGARVEPAEVESVLRTLAAVVDAAVVVADDGPVRLDAYVVHGASPDTDIEARLRRDLAELLPSWSLPRQVHVVEAIPRLVSGKVDRVALKSRSATAAHQPDSPQEPTPDTPSPSAVESVREVWNAVLRSGWRSLNDDFFEQGGDSLGMLRVLGRLRKASGRDIEVRDFYANPTPGGLAALISTTAPTGDGPSLRPFPGRDTFPLSPEQRRLWYLAQLEPESTAYVMVGRLRVDVPPEVEVVAAALDALVAKHPVLRCAVRLDGDEPTQTVETTVPAVPIERAERQASESADQARARVVNGLLSRPFDLAQPPLLRAGVLVDGPIGELYLAIHHAVCDGESWRLIERDVQASVRQIAMGGRPRSRVPSVSYPDYAAWLAETHDPAAAAEAIAWWRTRLKDLRPGRWFPPADRSAPPSGGLMEVDLDPTGELDARLERLARELRVSTYSVVMAAWACLQARRTERCDVLVATDASHRPLPETETMIGFFISTLLLPVHVDPDATFEQLVKTVADTLVDIRSRHHVPLDELVRHVPGLLERGGLAADVMVRSAPFRRRLALDVAPEPKLPLAIAITPAGATGPHDPAEHPGTTVTAEFDRGHLIDGEVTRLLDDFRQILRTACARPDLPLADLVGVSTDRSSANPAPLAAVEKIFHIAERQPSRVAVTTPDGEITYRDLRARVTTLADRCEAVGLAPGDVVAGEVAGLDGIVTLLACLRSGVVFTPLDPAAPPQRRTWMADFVGAAARIRVGADGLHVEPVEGRPKEDPLLADAAAIFFTSGSTGRPKAIVASRRAIDQFITWQTTTFRIESTDAVANTVGFGFDAVLRDVLTPLSVGGSIVIAPVDDPDRFWRILDRERVSIVHTVPGRLRSWLDASAGEELPQLRSMRLLFLAGEPLDATLVTRWRTSFPRSAAQVVNLYGPTETTMVRTSYLVPDEPAPGPVPVGRPIDATKILLEPSPESGGDHNILIATDYPSLGYLEQEVGGRVLHPHPTPYPTGDLGRLDDHGDLVITGRADDQVKISGVRVHPSETEQFIKNLGQVRDACVLPRLSSGEPGLRAFIVFDGPIDVNLVREECARWLPPAAVPREIVTLQALPVTANGKTDRTALAAMAAPETPGAELEGTTDADPDVATAVAVWSDVLRRSDIGPDTDFFAAGGHSLLATVLVARLKRAMGDQVPLRVILENPTPRRFVRARANQDTSTAAGYVIDRLATGSGGIVVALPPAHGLGDRYRRLVSALPEMTWLNVNVPQMPESGWDALLEGLASDIDRVACDLPVVLLGWSVGGVLAASLAERLTQRGTAGPASLILVDSAAPGSRAYRVDADWRREFLLDVARSAGARLDASALGSGRLGMGQMVAHFESITGVEADAEDLFSRLAVFRSLHQYAAQATLGPAIPAAHLLVASEGSLVHELGPTLGWDAIVQPDSVTQVPACHYTVLEAGQSELLRLVREAVS
jgi:amino acid adenylation domain-containing protein